MAVRETLTRSLRTRELAGDVRAGSYARSRAWREQRSYMRERWRWLVVAWLVLVAPVPVVWWAVPSELLRGVVLGGVVTGASAALWFWVVQSTGTAPLMMGDQAEQWTAQSLRGLGREWRLVNRFVLSSGDMDHVVVGPAGALVVETKWSAHPWHSEEGRRRQADAVRQVERSARQLRLWHEVKTSSIRVCPVVVLWGGATRQWASDECVRYVDGVAVVAGRALRGWIQSLGVDSTDHVEMTEQVWGALDAHARKRQAREPELFHVPLSTGQVLTRVGCFAAATTISFLAVAQVLAATGSLSWTARAGLGAGSVAVYAWRRWQPLRAAAVGVLAGVAFPLLLIAGALIELLVPLTHDRCLARLGPGARVVALISAAHAGRVALIWPA